MIERIRVFEIRKEVTRVEDKEKFILEFDEGTCEWIYLAPNAQKHTAEQLSIITDKLDELNSKKETDK